MLFEALALHLGFVTQAAIDQARQAEQEDAAGTLELMKVLVDREVLSAEQAETLEKLASDFQLRHEGILTRCLQAISPSAALRLDLARRLTELKSQQPTVPPNIVHDADRCGSDSRLADEETVPPGVVHHNEADRSELASEPRHADLETVPPENPPSRPPVGLEVLDEESDDEDEKENENGKEEHDSSPATPAPLGNRFQILRTHAHGGIGVVSVAFDSQLQREVALKQIKGDNADDPDSRARFLLEAEVTGRLEHPGIVPVYGLGFDDQGRPYYAMRFVRGITLDEAIARFHGADAGHDQNAPEQTLELRRLLGRFVSVCHTMAYAHSRGVLHRDLKPANVLLGPYNETLIVDWGLAKVLRSGQQPSVW